MEESVSVKIMFQGSVKEMSDVLHEEMYFKKRMFLGCLMKAFLPPLTCDIQTRSVYGW